MVIGRVLATVLIGVWLASAAVDAQSRRPTAEVATVVATKAPRRGSTVTLTAHVRLPQGLHVQSNKPRDPDLIPTEISLVLPTGVTLVDVTYPKPSDLTVPGFKQPLAVYPHEFDIVVRVKLGAQVPAGALSLPGTLRYQACNDTVCFPPSRTAISWSVPAPRG